MSFDTFKLPEIKSDTSSDKLDYPPKNMAKIITENIKAENTSLKEDDSELTSLENLLDIEKNSINISKIDVEETKKLFNFKKRNTSFSKKYPEFSTFLSKVMKIIPNDNFKIKAVNATLGIRG